MADTEAILEGRIQTNLQKHYELWMQVQSMKWMLLSIQAGWKEHQHAASLERKQPIWSPNTNMMGSVWPRIAEGDGIPMPSHKFTHTCMHPEPLAFQMKRPHTHMQECKQSCHYWPKCMFVMPAQTRTHTCWLIACEGSLLTHFAFQLRGSLWTLENHLFCWSPLTLIDRLVKPRGHT